MTKNGVSELTGMLTVRIGAGGEEQFSFFPWEFFHATSHVSGTGLVKLVINRQGTLYSAGVFGVTHAELIRMVGDAYTAWVGRMVVEKAAPKAIEDVVTMMSGKVLGSVSQSITDAGEAAKKGLDKQMRKLVLDTLRDLQAGKAEEVAEAANS